MVPRVLDSFQSIFHKAIDWIWSNVTTIVSKQQKTTKNNNRNKWYIWKQLCQTPKIFGLNLKKRQKSEQSNRIECETYGCCYRCSAMYFSATRHTFHEWVENSWIVMHLNGGTWVFFLGLLWFLFRICCQIDFGGFFFSLDLAYYI